MKMERDKRVRMRGKKEGGGKGDRVRGKGS